MFDEQLRCSAVTQWFEHSLPRPLLRTPSPFSSHAFAPHLLTLCTLTPHSQMLILDRVLGGDLITAHRLLRVVVSSAHLSSPAAEREYGPFAHSLAVILQVGGCGWASLKFAATFLTCLLRDVHTRTPLGSLTGCHAAGLYTTTLLLCTNLFV